MKDIIFLNIRQTFRADMTDEEIYEAVRGTWRLGERRNDVRYAFAVAFAEIRGVYRVQKWEPAEDGKMRFIGKSAAGLRNKYVGRYFRMYFNKQYGNLEDLAE